MLTRWCSRNSRDFGVVIGAASCPSVLHTLGYWAQKKKPAIPPLSSRTRLQQRGLERSALSCAGWCRAKEGRGCGSRKALYLIMTLAFRYAQQNLAELAEYRRSWITSGGLPARIGKVWANEFSSADHRLPSFLRGLGVFLSQRGDATEIASGLRGPSSYYFLGII